MRKTFTILLLCYSVTSIAQYSYNTASIGAGYIQDMYYSIGNMKKDSVSNSNWDIAFATSAFEVSIRANHTKGINVYVTESDSTGFYTLTDINQFEPYELYNSDESWMWGAFNQPAVGSQLDYGWGLYDINTHEVTGNRVFLLAIGTGNIVYKKVYFIRKSVSNQYAFMIANLDNSEFISTSFNATLQNTKHFHYYSINNNTFFNREPNKDKWDLLFTRYYAMQSNGTYYPAVGVLQNPDITSLQLNHTSALSVNMALHSDSIFSNNISNIGYDWKLLNSSFTFDIKDSLAYVVKAIDNNLYVIVFTGFEGSSSGIIHFTQYPVSILSASGPSEPLFQAGIFPNPAFQKINLITSAEAYTSIQYSIINPLGQVIIRGNINQLNDLHNTSIDISSLHAGYYLLQCHANNQSQLLRFIVPE
jgi:hypothetical protein